MTDTSLTFAVHNHNLAPSYAVPLVDAYQKQKNIHIVSAPLSAETNAPGTNPSSTNLPTMRPTPQRHIADSSLHHFFHLRLQMALDNQSSPQSNANTKDKDALPSYFPGAVIPGPGGVHCSEVVRGNLLFDQFKYLLQFDQEMFDRIKGLTLSNNFGQIESVYPEAAPSRLFSSQAQTDEEWLWHYVKAPKLFFLYQAANNSRAKEENQKEATGSIQVLKSFSRIAQALKDSAEKNNFNDQSVIKLLSFISRAWFKSTTGLSPVTWGEAALQKVRETLAQNTNAINSLNILPYLFELEAMASYLSLGEKHESFAHGVFAGNFIEVAMASVTSIKATEFCVRERLFDEVVNLSSRGFAPVIINEYSLVADGNHRLTAACVWNILKYCQDYDWSLDSQDFQRRVGTFAAAVKDGLLKNKADLCPVTLHQALNHLAYFLCRPDWRARLQSYTKPLLRRHDYIYQLPVVMLPEYLSGAVVKSLYDDGMTVERACPSIYEAMSLNEHLVLPPRASYHFTDAALLPWFTVLSTNIFAAERPSADRRGKRRTHSFGRRPRIVPQITNSVSAHNHGEI